MPAEPVDLLVEIAQTVITEPDILQYFIEYHEKNVLRGEWHREYSEIPFDQRIQARYGSQTSLFYLLAYLSALPVAEREYARRGIDPRIYYDTMREMTIWLCYEYDLRGIWEFKQFHWVWRVLSCEMFRLGRLQYMLIPFEGGIKAFRRHSDGQILLLADPSVALRVDGSAVGAGILRREEQPVTPEDGAWRAIFEEKETGWRGNPVSPYGKVDNKEVWLSRAEWSLVLQQGDTVLDLHIPRKDSFTAADCQDSMRQAYDFFSAQFPERPFKASYCHTWFFTPQLQQLLPKESNLVRFQREFYLYPFPGGPGFLWAYVFGERYQDPASAPRDTSLRRAVLTWLEEGRELFDLPGVRFHSPQDWGSQPYMSRWDDQHSKESGLKNPSR